MEQLTFLQEEEPTSPTISLIPDGVQPVPLDVAQQRGAKAAYGTGADIATITQGIASGNEQGLREEEAIKADIQWQKQRNEIINFTLAKARQNGKVVTPEEVDIMRTMSKEEFKTNPQTVFEKKYAQKYLRDKVVASAVEAPEGPWGKAYKDNPVGTAHMLKVLADEQTKTEYINKKIQDAETDGDQRSFLGKARDLALSMSQAVTWWNGTRILKGAAWNGLALPGTTRREQVSYILSQPLDRAQQLIDDTYTTLKQVNINDAQEFLRALKSYTKEAEYGDSLAGAIAVGSAPWGITAGALKAGLRRSVKILPKGEEIVTSDLSKTPPIREVQQDIVRKTVEQVREEALLHPAPVNYKTQLDLFRGDPRQADLFPTSIAGEAKTPPPLAGLPPGKLRSTYTPIAEQERLEHSKSMLPGRNLLPRDPEGRPYPRSLEGRRSRDLDSSVDDTEVFSRFTPGQGAYRQLPLDLRGGRGEPELPLDGRGFTAREAEYARQISRNWRTPVVEEVTGQPGRGGPLPKVEVLGPPGKSNFRQEGLDLAKSGPKTEIVDQHISIAEARKAADEFTASGTTNVPQGSGTAPAALYGTIQRQSQIGKGVIRITEDLPSSHSIDNFFGNSTSLSTQFRLKAVEDARKLEQRLEEGVDKSTRVTRIDPKAEKVAYETTAGQLLDRYSHKFEDGIIDVVHMPSYLFKANVGHAVLRMGRPDKTIFGSREAAELYARDMYKMAPDEFRIYQDDHGFYIGVQAPIIENSDRTLSAIAQLKNTIQTNFFTLLSKIRVADSYLTEAHSAQRKVAAHAQQNVRELVRSAASEFFDKLSKKSLKEVDTVLGDFGKDRKWFETATEFEQAFLQRHKKIATPEQIQAAFTYKQLQDYDFTIRNLGVYRDMARQGTEQFSVRISKTVSEFFNGIQHDNLPWGRGEDFTFMVLKEGEEPRVGWGHQADRAEGRVPKAEVEKLLQEGYKVIQVFSPSEKPMTKVFPEVTTPINYIVVKNYDTKPLAWQQLRYQPGPHSIYPYEFYIKQPVLQVGHLGKMFYYGDNTLWNFSTEAEAKMWLARLEEGRVKFNNKDADFDSWLAKNLPFTRKEFQDLKNHFDFEVPFSYTRSGKSVFETQTDLSTKYPDAINFHKSSHNPQNYMDRSFIQERDNLLKNPSSTRGVMKLEEAKQLDAFSALQRGLNQSIRGMWLNDYKVGSTVNWIENYADLFNVDLKNLRAAPLYYLYNAESNWKNVAKTDDNYTRLVAAKAERDAIVNFVGQGTDIGDAITLLQNKVMNTIYNKAGSDTANKFADYHLSLLKDPVPFMRGLAAHTKIGLFNPVAGIQQAMVMANVAALTKQEFAIPAVSAAFFMRGLSHNAEPAILNGIANKLERVGWKADDFKEMYRAFQSYGSNVVGSEAAFRMDAFDNKLFRGKTQIFLDKGFMFFNAGERLGRKSAFAAAYKEWKAANPTRTMTDADIALIGNRADTMTGNMTSASLANMQNGVLSIPLQFTTYFKHMAELMLGNKITPLEKARLFAYNSALFGIPIAAGIGGVPGAIGGAISGFAKDGVTGAAGHSAAASVGMWPIYDDIKEEAFRRGYDLNNNLFVKALAEGIPAMMFKAITGKDIEPGKVFGTGGSSVIRDMLRQDKGFLETMAGASGSVAGDIIEGTYPLLRKMAGVALDDSFGPLQASDYMKAFRNIAVIDTSAKAYGAFVYGKLISKGGVEVGGLDNLDAALLALRLNPRQYQDINLARNVMKDIKDSQQKFENLALEAIRRANSYAIEGDWKKYDEYLKDAKAYINLGDFSPDDRLRIFQRGVNESKGIEQNTLSNFIKRTPQSLQINKYDHFFVNKGNK